MGKSNLKKKTYLTNTKKLLKIQMACADRAKKIIQIKIKRQYAFFSSTKKTPIVPAHSPIKNL